MSDAADARLELERLIESDAPALRATLPLGFLDAVQRYVGLLLRANEHLNLTRITEPSSVARLHLLDALSALPAIDELGPRRGVDLGSGGGVPGIILALARRDVSWTLVDSVRKKADALRGIADALGLGNVTVIAERAESLGRQASEREGSDLVVARACAAMPVLLEYALPLVRIGGGVVAWKGALGADELRAGRAASAQLGGSELEARPTGIASLGAHQLVTIRKLAATPSRYPRRPGEPARHPLG